MTILALDTCGKNAAVALKTDHSYHEINMNIGFSHAETIMKICDDLFRLTKTSREVIDLIACPRGPGSFTGLRIGMATAKGLALALQKPLISVNTLEAYSLATQFMPTLVALDARKNRFYTALFHEGKRLSTDLDITAEEIDRLEANFPQIMITGEGAETLHQQLSSSKWLLDPQFRASKVAFIATFAEKLYPLQGADDEHLGPDYLRLSDAEELLQGKTT